ncbi:MAG: hypothetical protein IJO59_01925 [Clostridia bacterium]|nr:hypothetical protein [Clostridia bacterium]
MRWTLPNGTEFAGNTAAKAAVDARLKGEAFPHAILIEGPVGSGRRTVAKLIAAAALCGEREVPCGVCNHCRRVMEGIHPDVTEVGGTGEARSFHVDEIRRIREEAYILPNEGRRRVFILRDAGQMTEQAQNALLKLLEEPPSHVVLILTCEQRFQLLDTVLSRVFPVTLTGVDTEAAVAVLAPRFPDKTADELHRVAALWGGVIGQAEESLRGGTYAEIVEIVSAVANGIVAPAELELLKATAKLEKRKEAVGAVMSGLQLILRDALAARSGAAIRLSTDPNAAETLSRQLAGRQLLELLAVIEDLQLSRRFNMNHTLFITALCARLRRAAGR